MTALEFLKLWKAKGFIPPSNEGSLPCRPPSNAELKRWLLKGSVLINGAYPKPDDEISYPIKQLVFNAKGKRRCTMVWDD